MGRYLQVNEKPRGTPIQILPSDTHICTNKKSSYIKK